MAHFSCNKLGILIGVLFIGAAFVVNGHELEYSDIEVVTNETRFQTLYPDVVLDAFDKIRHVKGNYYFSKGQRITGDRLLLNFYTDESFSRAEDIQVRLRYPAEGVAETITFIEVLADLTSENADTYLFEGGISQKFFALLMECNETFNFSYEIFIYGY